MNSEQKIKILASAIDQLLNGTLLDEYNHDDNGLSELVQRADSQHMRNQLMKHQALLVIAAQRTGLYADGSVKV